MATKSKFMERFGPQVRIQDVNRVSSGSPVRLSLTHVPNVNAPEAAGILMRRHVPLRTAHTVLTEMIENAVGYILAPVVEDVEQLRADLFAHGVIAKVHAPIKIGARKVRERTGLSQEAFALRYGLDVSTLRNWEQNRSEPDAAATTLLWTIARNPAAVEQSIEMEDAENTAPAYGI
jgi:DNA-binding transcriptional regulator YiaG